MCRYASNAIRWEITQKKYYMFCPERSGQVLNMKDIASKSFFSTKAEKLLPWLSLWEGKIHILPCVLRDREELTEGRRCSERERVRESRTILLLANVSCKKNTETCERIFASYHVINILSVIENSSDCLKKIFINLWKHFKIVCRMF